MARIVIVQPVLTAYRKTFFDGVVTRLEQAGHTCLVVTGEERGRRQHSVTADWHRKRKGFSLKLWDGVLRYFGSAKDLKSADLVVVPLSTLWVDTYIALVLRKIGIGPKSVIVWGHVDSHSGAPNNIRERLVDYQLRACDFVFAYTERGRRSALARGVAQGAAASLDNTVDLKSLAAAVEYVAHTRDVGNLADLSLSKHKTFSYIGGLDGAKRIDFLADVLEKLWEVDQEVKLLVGGTGAQESLLHKAVERGQVVMMGKVDETGKAAMALASSALLMPGRVGLVAPESFVLGLPIITTQNPYHAPEFDYLSPGHDCIVTHNTVDAYSKAIIDVVAAPDDLNRLRIAALSKSGWPSLDNMIEVFSNSCVQRLTFS